MKRHRLCPRGVPSLVGKRECVRVAREEGTSKGSGHIEALSPDFWGFSLESLKVTCPSLPLGNSEGLVTKSGYMAWACGGHTAVSVSWPQE